MTDTPAPSPAPLSAALELLRLGGSANGLKMFLPAGVHAQVDELYELAKKGLAASETVQQDAERYRWLRDKSANQYAHPICVEQHGAERGMKYIGPLLGESLDMAIDAAILLSPERNSE